MRSWWRKFVPVLIGVLAGSLVIATASVAQNNSPSVRPGPAEPVVIVGTDPVPVSGDVSATLDEPVEVEAGGSGLSVDVASLETRLDELKTAVEALAPAPPGEPVAKVCQLISQGGDAELYCVLSDPILGIGGVPPEGPPDAPSEVLIHSITINSVDEELEIQLWKDGEFVTTVVESFEDSLNGPVLHLTYPMPIEADVIVVDCENEFETCNVKVSWVGQLSSDS